MAESPIRRLNLRATSRPNRLAMNRVAALTACGAAGNNSFMKTLKHLRFGKLVLACTLAAFAWTATTARAEAPGIISHQGKITVGGNSFTGTGQFKFALVNAAGTSTYWSNDGTAGGEPTAAVSLAVSRGIFSVNLGDTTVANMTTIPASVFANSAVYLRVWFNDGTNGSVRLSPDRRVTSVGYALQAATATTAASADAVAAANVTGTLGMEQLPAGVLTNGASAVSLTGSFTGNGAGMTNVDLRTVAAQGAIAWVTNWGDFLLSSSPAVGASPKCVIAANVNGDAHPDLISANLDANTLSVLTNNGLGGFALAASPTTGVGPVSVAAADLNGDGLLDLISANYSANTLTVLTNDGHGGWVLAFSPTVGSWPLSVTTADVNGDALADVISANYYANTLSVLTNDSRGGLTLSSSPVTGNGPNSLAAADVNRDGWVDLVSANQIASTLSVLTNNGHGGFVLASSPAIGASFLWSVVAADVTGDGAVDLMSFGLIPPLLTVLTNNGTGSFVLASTNGLSELPRSLAAAEVNGDGRVDLICGSEGIQTLSVLTNAGGGRFVLASSPGAGRGNSSLTAADVTGDGGMDLISANATDNTLSVLFNTPAYEASFTGSGSGLTNLNATSLTAGTVALARLPGAVVTNNATGLTLAGAFTGNGAGLTNLNANVALLSSNQVFTASNRFAGVVTATNVANTFAGTFTGNGTGLTLNTNVALRSGGNTFTGNQIVSSGNVGLGTNNPAERLTIAGATSYGTGLKVTGSATSGTGITLENTATGGHRYALFAGSTANGVGAGGFAIYDDTTATHALAVSAAGNVGIGKATPTTALDVNGTVTATGFAGNGGGLTSLAAANLTGTLADARLSTNVALLNTNQAFTASNRFAGVVTATNAANTFVGAFTGNAAGLTNLDATDLTGTLADARLSTNVALRNASQTFSGVNNFTNPANTFAGDGSALAHVNLNQADGSALTVGQTWGDGPFQVYGSTWTMDQQNASFGYFFNGYTVWQSFTCGTNGNLAAIKVWVYSRYGGPWSATLNLHAGEGTGGALLASQPVAGDGVMQERTFALETPVALTVSNQYTFAFQNSSVPIRIRGSSDVYAGGRSDNASYDYNFSTWMTNTTAVPVLVVQPNTLYVGIGKANPTSALDVNGTVTATAFVGNGSGLTNLDATDLTGTLADARLSANVALLNTNQAFTASNRFAGVVTATNVANTFVGAFTGNGGGLTNLDASDLSTGTMPLARLPGSVVTNNATGLTLTGSFTGNGSGLTSLDATDLTGTVPDARLSANVALRAGGNTLSGNQILSSGNVGLGTASPAERLTIAGVTSYGTGIKVTGSATSGTGIALENTAGGHRYALFAGSTGNGVGAGGFAIYDDTTAFHALSVSAAGNVGIGKATAATALDVNGTVTATGFAGNGAGLTNLPAAAVAAAPPGMVLIPAGAFTMGNAIAADTDITDAATVTANVSAFYMDVNLVTLSQWQSVYYWATSQGYTFGDAGAGKAANHPVHTVNWYDCVKWCNARSQQAGKTPVYYKDAGFTQVYMNGDVDTLYPNWAASGYRLPTEAEWEKAARGGLSGQRFPWGNVINQNLANHYGNTTLYSYDLGPNGLNAIGSIGGTAPATSPVGSFAANGYGLNDMAGNVFQWCWDWYATPYAGGSDPHGPAGPLYFRVVRGGSWFDRADDARCADRGWGQPDDSEYIYGFRCVRGL